MLGDASGYELASADHQMQNDLFQDLDLCIYGYECIGAVRIGFCGWNWHGKQWH